MKIIDFFQTIPGHRVIQEWRGTEEELSLERSDRKTKVLWECHVCHQEMSATPYQRLSKKNLEKSVNCRVCAGLQVVPGYNDLATLRPDIASQWSQDNQVTPQEVSVSSAKKVVWECQNNHTWVTSVSERTRSKKPTGCPHCHNRSERKGVTAGNNLAVVSPEIAILWDYDKNDDPPETYLPYSQSSVWWKDMDHSFPINQRTGYSAKKKQLKKKTQSISMTHPDVASLLSIEDSRRYSIGTRKQLMFTCDQGHSWSQRPANFLRDGSTCPHCEGRRFTPGVNDVKTLMPGLMEYVHESSPVKLDEVSVSSTEVATWICDNGHITSKSVITATRVYVPNQPFSCITCGTSREENDIADYLSRHIDLERNIRSLIPPREVDIYIPEKKIAIEYNGLYWHSDKYVDKRYHYDKWKKCKDQGVQLITIWEDDWKFNQEIVKKMLIRKISVSDESKVFARKCTVTDISYHESSNFLDEHHIQGGISGSRYLGLIHDDVLVAVMVFIISDGVSSLERYATSCIVPGGFSRLLKYFENTCSGIHSIITFSDNTVSDGGLYYSQGFKVNGHIAPDYKYVVNSRRHHKFGYRLQRFKNDPDFIYHDDMTEKELADLNGLVRVWDCGKVRWIKELH